MPALTDREARERVGRLEATLERLDALDDAGARAAAVEAVQALLELYGEGLARIVGHAARSVDADALAAAFASDELVAHLLVLHGLHPDDLESRVLGALDDVRPYLQSHGGDVELLGVEAGVAHVRLQGHCKGCPSSTVTLRTAVEEAVLRAAPELERIEAEGADGVAAAAATAQPALVQLQSGGRRARAAGRAG